MRVPHANMARVRAVVLAQTLPLQLFFPTAICNSPLSNANCQGVFQFMMRGTKSNHGPARAKDAKDMRTQKIFKCCCLQEKIAPKICPTPVAQQKLHFELLWLRTCKTCMLPHVHTPIMQCGRSSKAMGTPFCFHKEKLEFCDLKILETRAAHTTSTGPHIDCWHFGYDSNNLQR